MAASTSSGRPTPGLLSWLFDPIVIALAVFFSVGIALLLWQQHYSQQRRIVSLATHAAQRRADAIEAFRTLYTLKVVEPLRMDGIIVTDDYEGKRLTIPLPATLSRELGEAISQQTTGGRTLLYSPYPFLDRIEKGGLKDDFARHAWDHLQEHPGEPFSRLEEVDGRLSLRFAVADLMRESCIECHNTHTESPKTDWKVGDVRGVLEVSVPLEHAMEQSSDELWDMFWLTTGAALLALISLALVIGRLRRSSAQLEWRVEERTSELSQANTELESQAETLRESRLSAEQLRHKAEDAERRLRVIIESVPSGIVLSSADGKIVMVNSETERMFGYDRSELLGKEIRMLVPEDLRDRHVELRNEYIADPQPRRMTAREELSARRKDGSLLPVAIGLSPVEQEDGLFVVAAIADVSEQRKAAEELKHYADELERSNQDLDEFASIVSHDLKEPLRGIKAYAGFLAKDYADKLDAEGRENLDTIARLCGRMDKLIEVLLHFSRVGRAELAFFETDMDELTREVLDELHMLLQEQRIEVRIPQPLPTVTCDAIRVRELLRNLITNAAKYNDKPQKWIEVGFQRDESAGDSDGEGRPIFYVRDNGIGIRDRHLDSVFGMFKRLHGHDKFGGGTGAGLAFVKRIVERHGGKIWVESTPGEGSTFYFTLS